MSNIDKISLCTCVFRDPPTPDSLARHLETVREAGYEYIEISSGHRSCFPEAVKIVRDSGLKVWSVHGCLSGACLAEDESVRTESIDWAFRWAEAAADFAPCPLVEHYLDRFNDPGYGRRFRRSIEQFYEKVSRLGYILCIETAPYKPLENERYPDSAEIAGFVRSFRRDDLQMTVDINHSNIHENLLDAIGNTRGLIRNIHVSDNHGEKEEHLPPGEGIIDFSAAFQSLRENGYAGPCNLEFHYPDNPEPSADDLREVRLGMERILWGR